MNLKAIEPRNRSDAREILTGALDTIEEKEIDSAAVLLYSRTTGSMYIRTSRSFGRLEVIGAIEEIKMAIFTGTPLEPEK